MTDVKVSDLPLPALAWAVGEIEGLEWDPLWKTHRFPDPGNANFSLQYHPETNWLQAGPIIERERILLKPTGDTWVAYSYDQKFQYGPTLLIAAMRCLVASRHGSSISVPDELLKEPSLPSRIKP